jgi:hypothetical protein
MRFLAGPLEFRRLLAPPGTVSKIFRARWISSAPPDAGLGQRTTILLVMKPKTTVMRLGRA